MTYKLELNKIIERIKEKNHKRILIQLPDGLKTQGKNIVDQIKKETDCEVFLWLGSCFGACDLPTNIEQFKIDLTVSFGHNRFIKKEGW